MGSIFLSENIPHVYLYIICNYFAVIYGICTIIRAGFIIFSRSVHSVVILHSLSIHIKTIKDDAFLHIPSVSYPYNA